MSELVMEQQLDGLRLKDLVPVIREIVREEQARLRGPAYVSEQRHWQWQRIREEYILMLVREGYNADQIERLVEQFDATDRQWAADAKTARTALHDYGQARFRAWCQARGIDYNDLSDEQVTELMSQVLSKARNQA